jgi:hypothetical protein
MKIFIRMSIKLLKKIHFWYESKFIYCMPAKQRAGLSLQINDALKSSRISEVERLVNEFYPYLSTNQGFGHCTPLQLKKRISLSQAKQEKYVFKITIQDNVISYEGDFAQLEAGWSMNRLLAYHQYFQSAYLDNEQINLHIADCYSNDDPVFIACSNQSTHTLIPDPDYLGSRGYQSLRRSLDQKVIPFEHRKNILFWRGGVNCRPEFMYPWRMNPRLGLCLYVNNLNLYIAKDVKAVAINYYYKDICDIQEIQLQGIVGDHVNILTFQKYKYHIDIDGFSNAWSGLFTKLLMGCVVFKVKSIYDYRQWYYKLLVPFKHFIPVASDLSNLEEQIDWAIKNPRACNEISCNAMHVSRYIVSLDYS